jgi:hypothetical protein
VRANEGIPTVDEEYRTLGFIAWSDLQEIVDEV